jgi:hypothetical protein
MDKLIRQIRDFEQRMCEADTLKAKLADERALAIERLIVREGSVAAAAAVLGVTRQAANKALLRARALSREARSVLAEPAPVRKVGRPRGARNVPRPAEPSSGSRR